MRKTPEVLVAAKQPAAQRTPSLRSRMAPWLPLILLVSLGLMTMAGYSLSAKATAAATDTVTVTASVGADLQVDGATGCDQDGGTAGNQLVMPALSAAAGIQENVAACTIAAGSTNNPNGVDLNVKDARAAHSAFMCLYDPGENCATANFADPGANPAATVADDEVALRLAAVANGATADWNTASPNWYTVPANAAAAAVPCHTTAPSATLGTCNFFVGMNTSPSQDAGSYEGELYFEATAR